MIDRAESEATSLPFDFEIPKEGPLTYEGILLRIIWEVVAEADIPLGRDEEVVTVFAVVARRWDPAEWD